MRVGFGPILRGVCARLGREVSPSTRRVCSIGRHPLAVARIGIPAPTQEWQAFGIALLSGDESLLRDAIGMRVFWFLPTLYSLAMLRALASTSGLAGCLVAAVSVSWMAVAGQVST